MSDKLSVSKALSALQQAGSPKTQFSSKSISIEEVTGTAILKLHSLRPAAELSASLRRLGCDLPLRTGGAAGQDPALLCLRPGEWLLISDTRSPAALLNTLTTRLELQETALLDFSDGFAMFRLAGGGAGWLLGKLGGLDFRGSPDAGQYTARTRMDHFAVVVHYHRPLGGSFVFDLLIERSLAPHLWSLLRESAPHADELSREFGGME
ncbi:MAG: hypothetical protein RQ826_06285 [Xanthomonadales bacterium]|nr:hypothetical protein [Xanthomonadales bacterium]